MFEDFKKFILKGSIIDLAIGFTVGASFSSVARSLVDNVLMPPIGLVLGRVDFSNLFVLLKQGNPAPPYNTVQQAHQAGAVTLNYGSFLNSVISLLIVALAMYLVIRFISQLNTQLENKLKVSLKAKSPATKKCPYCLTALPTKAIRCSACTSKLKGFRG